MWCMWGDSKAHGLHYLSVWQVSQWLPWRRKLKMSIPLFTNSIKKMHFLKVWKRKSALPFKKLPGTSLPFSPWSLLFFFLCSFNSPTTNIYLCQILSAHLFPSLFLWSSRMWKIPYILVSLEAKQMREETKQKKFIQFGKHTLILIHVFTHQVNEGLSPPLNDSSSLLQTHR